MSNCRDFRRAAWCVLLRARPRLGRVAQWMRELRSAPDQWHARRRRSDDERRDHPRCRAPPRRAAASPGRRWWRIPGDSAAWDGELSIRCTVQMGMDRRLRCLPERVDPNVRRVFLDAECTQPIIEICSPDPKLAGHEDAPRGHPSEAARVLAGAGRTDIHNWALYPHPSHFTDPFHVIPAGSGESPKAR